MAAVRPSAVSQDNHHDFSNEKASPSVEFTRQEQLYTIDDLIVNRASTNPNGPVLGYPKSTRGCADYEYYSNKDLDRFADEAAKHLISDGLPAKVAITSLEDECPNAGTQ